MIGDAAFEHAGKVFSDDDLLFGRERKRIWNGKVPGQLCGHRFGGLASGRENEDWPEVFRKRARHESGPIPSDFAGRIVTEAVRMNFL